MINHFHLLVKLEGGGVGLSKLMRDIKSLSARQIFPNSKGIWMERFDDVSVTSGEQFRRKLNYIHFNPVKAKLVEQAENYRFSSAKSWNTGKAEAGVTVDF